MRENNLDGSLLNFSFLLVSAIVGVCVLLLMYIIRMLKNDNQTNIDVNVTNKKNVSKSLSTGHHQDQQHHSSMKASSTAGSKKRTGGGAEPKWVGGRATDKHNYTHPWLLTSFKGHTGQVLDMDFSSNGKYLASCAEEPDPGGHSTEETTIERSASLHASSSGNSSRSSNSSSRSSSISNECNKENSRPTAIVVSSPCGDKKQGLSRRQRKNRRREDSSPPAETKKKSRTKRGYSTTNKDTTTSSFDGKKLMAAAPLKQFAKLGLNDVQLSAFLRSYLLSTEQMLALGYPVESELHPGRVIIFKSPTTAPQHYNPYKASRFDVNAREFIPQTQQTSIGTLDQYVNYSQIKQAWSSSHSSGGSRGGSSDSSSEPASFEDVSDDNGTSSDQDSTVKSSGSAVRQINSGNGNSNHNFITSEERQCVRCGHGFFVASDGEYLTQEHCVYHWGKLQRVFMGPAIYSCCRNVHGAKGCTIGKLHVWNGVGVGFNGPFDSYARTRPRKTPPPDGNFGVYALDCEMCYTIGGLELAKITVVGGDGRLVYDCFVKPEHDIVDYNTRFSGITAHDLNKRGVSKCLRDVQNDLMGFVNADTILIGHGLENDLRALRIMHGTVVDTAVTFPHYNGLPYRRSLKSLTHCYLKREIQCGNAGHNSCEDARASMELMLWRMRKDFKPILEHLEHQRQNHFQQQQQH